MRSFIIICGFLITGLFDARMYATDFNDMEIAKLRSFLMQESAVPGKKNYQQIGLESMDHIDWKATTVNGLYFNGLTYLLERVHWGNAKIAGHLDLSGFAGLEYLYCGYNQLKSVNIENASALLICDFYENNLNAVDVTTNPLLTYLRVGYNNLRSIDLSNNQSLDIFCCTRNQITTLDISNNASICTLYCVGNDMQSIKLDNCTALENFYGDFNNFDILNFSHLPKLKYVACRINKAKELNFHNCVSLEELYCNDNELSVLDLSKCANLKILNCNRNRLTSLDLSVCRRLETVYCENNQLYSLEVSNSPLLTTLYCKNNNLNFLSLPVHLSTMTTFLYAPQYSVSIECAYDNVDFTGFYYLSDFTSKFLWKHKHLLIYPVENQDGRFVFDKSLIGETITCSAQNETFPYLVMSYSIKLTPNGGSGNVNPLINSPLIYAGEQSIQVKTDKPALVCIYSIQGLLCAKKTVSAGHTVIPVERGMYVVVVDDKAQVKVIVR